MHSRFLKTQVILTALSCLTQLRPVFAAEMAVSAIEVQTEQVSAAQILQQATIFNDASRVVNLQDEPDYREAKALLSGLKAVGPKEISGYKNTKVWVAFDLVNRTERNQFVLRYSYPSMQRIDFWAFDESGKRVAKYQSGKFVPFDQRPIQDSDYQFPLEMMKNQRVHVLMSFESSGSMQLPVELYSNRRMQEVTQNKYLIYGLYYGVIFLILIYSAFLAWSLRESLYVAYSGYIVSVVLSQMCLHGIAYRYLWPGWHEWNKVSTIFFVPLMFFFLAVFTIIALDLKKKVPMAFRVLTLFALFAAVISVSSLFVYGNTLVRITGALTIALPFIVMPPAIFAWRRGVEFSPFYLLAVFFYVIGASLYGMKDSGVLESNFFTENGILIGSLLEISIFSMGIASRIRRFQRKTEQLKLELEKSNILGQMAAQISHDIRSPLSALNLLTGQLSKIPEEQRIIIRSAVGRINDIANHLLQKGKDSIADQREPKPLKDLNDLEPASQLLAPLIDLIASEKRIQFREKQNVVIEADIAQGFGLFAKVDALEFKRALSNLLNNAIEALPNDSGKVVVTIESTSAAEGSIDVTIRDTGQGIPEPVLKELGKRGLSFGKSQTSKSGGGSGNGLGLFHAKTMMESVGGSLHLSSREGVGTTVSMRFKRAAPPNWFLEKLQVTPPVRVVVLDDDISIHQIWRARFDRSLMLTKRSAGLSDTNGLSFVSFTSGSEFKQFVLGEAQNQDSGGALDALYLVDFELLGQNQNGIEIIEELGIAQNSVLVTSRFEETQIRAECQRLGIKILPKAMAAYVPIAIDPPKEFFDAVLLDDDPLTHQVWQIAAEEQKKRIVGFHSPSEFFKRLPLIDRHAPLFIDSNLGDGIKGEEISRQAHEAGFSTIYLASGYNAEDFAPMPWLKGIVGKEPLFLS